MLVHLKGVLNHDQLRQLSDWFNQVQFDDGRMTAAGDLARQVKNNLQVTMQTPGYAQAVQVLREALSQNVDLKLAALPQKIMPPMFSRYEPGMSYGEHLDAPVMMGGSIMVRTDISMTVFLSSPDIYEGGELVVQTDFGEQRFKGDAGDAVLYGSSFFHHVEPVRSGVRLVAVTWIQSMIRDHAKRQLIYDLGRASNALQADYPEREDVQLVEQVRCKLERMWYEI